MQSEPVVKQVKNGWHALSPGLAVWGKTRNEAIARYHEAVATNAVIRARADPTEVGGDQEMSLRGVRTRQQRGTRRPSAAEAPASTGPMSFAKPS